MFKQLRHLWPFVIRYRIRLILGFFFVTLSNFLVVWPVNYIGKSIRLMELLLIKQTSTTEKDILEKELIFYSFIIMGIPILAGGLKYIMRQTIIVMGRYVEYDLRNAIYEQYQRLNPDFYRKHATGDLMNRISEDTTQIRFFLGLGIMFAINLLTLLIMVMFFMIPLDPILSLYVMLPLPILTISLYYLKTKVYKRSLAVSEQLSKIASFVQDTFSGIDVIKSYALGSRWTNFYNNQARIYKHLVLKLSRVDAYFSPLVLLVIGLSNILVLYAGSIRFLDGEISDIGVLAQFFIYLNLLIWPFTSIGWVVTIVQKAEASQKRINDFLNARPTILNTGDKKPLIKGSIQFKDVSYIYENKGIKALNKINFTLDAHKILAIVGETGSGKTTLANLLLRLSNPTEGEILIDEIPIEQIDLTHLRKNIGYVSQEHYFFSDSIAQNIGFGLDTVDDINLRWASKQANIEKTIDQFTLGYETPIGERGISLSGGQKQRLNLARAFIVRPPILIIDDALSALDNKAQRKVLENITVQSPRPTVILITHHLVMAKTYADRILRLKNGSLIALE